jgi:hypothetical protein
VQTERAWIAARELARLRERIEALSDRGVRLGTGPIELDELDHRDGEVLVELSGDSPGLEGWEVVGRLDHPEGGRGRLGFAGPGLDRGAWSGAEPWCEHCGLLRRRRVTYLVRQRGGEIRQIGSSCLRDYTGHDLGSALRQAELLGKGAAEIHRSAASRLSDRDHPPLEDFLALLIAVVRDNQAGTFVPRSRSSKQRPASADLALKAWSAGRGFGTPDRDAARDLISWGLAHLRSRRRNDYEERVVRLLERGGRLTHTEAAVIAGLYVLEERWRERGFLGPVGARVEVEVEVQRVRAAGCNRFGEVVWHVMRDGRGRLASWFASGGRRLKRGGRYRLRARVRRHGEWRGRPVTVLSRCSAEPI